MTFEYMMRTVVDASIEIDDPGNCALRANNDSGEEFYLIVKTELGWTEMLTFGPIIPDISQLPRSSSCNYSRIEYSEYKINSAIQKFLNNPYSKITQVMVVDKEEAKSCIKNLADYI